MTMAWVLYVLLVGSLLVCAALSLDGLLRRTSLPTRWVWVATLAGIVALAVLAPQRELATTRFRIASSEIPTTVASFTRTPSLGVGATLAKIREDIASSVSRALIAADARVPALVVFGLGMTWCLFSALVVALLVIMTRRVRLARREWPLASVHGVPVRVARTLGPAVIGFAKPEIVVPRSLLSRTEEEQRLVIVHEGEHVAARDQLLLIGGWIVVALLPWHPATWWALSRMRLAIELDCDARVLRRGVAPRPYGALLIDLAGEYAGLRVGALALADGSSHLERRLLAMTRTRTRLALARAAALGAVATLSIAMACEARLPTSAEVDAMNVASAEKAAVRTNLIAEGDGKSVIYTVNGQRVSKEEAHAIAASRIATINVSKEHGERGAGDSVYTFVRVMTDEHGQKMKVPMTATFKRTHEGAEHERMMATKMKSEHSFDGILVIDGVVSPGGSLAKLSRDDIVSVDVLKGEAAARAYADPAAQNGVIRVTTKRGATAARP